MDRQLAEKVVVLLNEIHAADPAALAALVAARVPCNSALADHPSVQVGQTDDGGFEVGIMGVLNGLCGVDQQGRGAVAVVLEDDGSVTDVRLLQERL